MRRPRGRLLTAVGVLLLVGGAVGIGYPLWWGHRSSTVGALLVRRALSARASWASCPTTSPLAATPSGGPGVLQIPSISLTAPVLDGLTDEVLNVAVGHEPGTLWPGAPGEALLEAHDVSYFANLQAVRPGAEILWTTRCLQAVFKVTGAKVSEPGATIPAPAGGTGLVLVTCYPTNALFWTSQRYVLTTSLVSESIGKRTVPSTPSVGAPLIVPATPSLVAQGLGLDQSGNSLLLHTLQLTGTPSRTFVQGPLPLQVEADALAVVFGAAKAVETNNASWWSSVTTKGLVRPRTWPLTGATVNVSIAVRGSTAQSVTIASAAATAVVTISDRVLRLSRLT